jgi:hypothetical protein
MIFMKGRTKVLIVLLILSVYGACIVSTKGKLPNQTATIIDVENDKIFSLAVNETQVSLGQPIPLDYPRWNVEGKNATKFNDGKTLIISSVINYTKKFVFNATLNGLHLSFSVFPYFHAIISSRPDISIDFFVGTLELNSTLKDELRTKHKNIVADENFIWVNCSSINGEFFDKHRDHPVTINVGEILLKIGLINRPFSALAIKVKYIGFKPELDNICRVEIKSLYLLKKLPYYAIVNEGKSCPLLDGTTAYIIKRDGNFIQVASDYPYLQRAYIKYSINASSNALYTIFLVSKKSEEVVASRSNFLFSHSSRLDEIGTHIDWRQLVLLNPNFDPIGGLYSVMGDGDYAIIFAPVNRSKLESVKLYKVEFTFSKAQYTEFILPTLSEQTLLAATLFILITAGILPTSLLLALIYTHGKRSLKNNKKSVTRILIAGFAIRLILAPLTAYTNDLQIFAQLGALYFGSGILGAQWVSLPGFVYIQIATYFPYALLRAAGFQDFQFLALSIFAIEAFFAKIPSILGDLGTVFYLRKMSQKYMPEKEALLVGLYMLNPLTIYISGILGQFDPIFLFTIILSIYYLTAKYDKVKATIFSSLALIINPIGAATFIPLLAKVKNKENLFAAVKVLLLAFSIISALMLPFFFEPKSPVLLTSYERFLTGIPGEAFYSKQFNFYLYGIIISSSVGYGLTFRFMLELLGHELGPLFYPLGTLAAFFALTVFFIYQMYRTKKVNAHETLLIGTFMLCTAIIFQLTFPTIYDQFVIWIAGLLLVAYLLSKEKIFITIFTIISITTGCIYVAVWRNYVQLISGVERVSLGNPYLSNIMSASIGVLYSAMLIVVLIIVLKLWLQKPREQQ